MKNIVGTIRRCGGKTASYLLAVIFALAAAQSAQADEIVDLGGEKYSGTASVWTPYEGKIVTNGTFNLTGESGWTAGTYTLGDGAIVNCSGEFNPSGDYNLNIVGGEFNMTGGNGSAKNDPPLSFPLRNGQSTLLLDGGTLTSVSARNYENRLAVNIGFIWNNRDSSKNVDFSAKAVLINNSTLSCSSGALRISGAKGTERKLKTSKVDFAVTNSTINVNNAISIGTDVLTSNWVSDSENSYVRVVFGPGSDITCDNIYAYKSLVPEVLFDGATVHKSGSDGNFIGQNTGLSGDIYTIGAGGLTIDIPSDQSFTAGSNMSVLKGAGGITKIGDGSITVNSIVSSSTAKAMTFTGPLVVSNGTWSSSLSYAATSFAVDGANSTLALSGALTNATVSLAATDGGTLTLAGATTPNDAAPNLMLASGGTTDYFTRDSAVGTYALDSLTLGEGAVLDLDADATTVDVINATTTNITATSANPATVNINFTAAPAAGATFTFFETDSADKFTVVPKLGNVPIPSEVSVVDGVLMLTVTADDYTWNGTGTNWGDTGAWTKNDASVDWSDGNNAIFGTANATAVLAADASAAEVRFTADATISGSATLTALKVNVAEDVAATISAPTAGSLEKTGAGTLTLGVSRTDQTTLSEGTLALTAGNDAITVANLTLGTDAAKPIALDYGGNTLSAKWTDYLTPGMDITLTNGTFSTTQNPGWTAATFPKTLTIAKGATMTTSERFTWNVSDTAGAYVTNYVNIAGGSLVSTKDNNNWIVQNSRSGTLKFDVSDGGLLELSGQTYILPCRDSTTENDTPSVLMTFNDSTFRVKNKHLFLGYDNESGTRKNPLEPIFELAMTNSTLNVGTGSIKLGHNVVQSNHGGHSTADFENCIITAKQFTVYYDRPANAARFNNSTIVLTADSDYSLEAQADLDAQSGEEWAGRTPITVGPGGLTLDTPNNTGCGVKANIAGGPVTKKGTGTLTIHINQTSTSALNVNEGTVEIASGVILSRAISVASGATLSIVLDTATPVATAESFSFASGSTLAISLLGDVPKGKYPLFTLSSGTFESNPLADATIVGPIVPYTISAEGSTVYLNIEENSVTIDNASISSLTVTDNTILLGIGGAKLSTLSFGATGKLTLDPIKTPIKVSATPTFAEGAKIALLSDYAAMTCGRVVLMTYSGEATIPEGLFDSSSVSGTATLSQETAPDGTSKQLILTVGDYENEAKEIRILPVGDSITQGVKNDAQNDYPQYRTTIAARLAANGYKPVMKGVWYKSQNDAAGVQQPDEWRWHSGISAERIMIGGTHGGVRDNMHVYLDIAGDVHAITILIGTNDIGSSGRTPEATYAAYTNLVFATAAQRPNAKIFGSTILDRDDKNDSVRNSIAAFNTYLRTDYEAGRLPANYVMLDLCEALPVVVSGNFFDKLHPNWKGDAVIGDAFASAIMTALPLTGEGAISGAPDAMVTDEVQTALGAANIPELADYRSGMTPIFTIDAAAKNGFKSAPYTTTNNIVSLNRNVTKVGYYMELVRKGTNRRRYVWVDFDAAGKTLGEVDFPWDGENLDFVAEKLHVYSNDPSIHNVEVNDNTVTGVVEGTWHNYNGSDDNDGVPVDVIAGKYGWNDTLNTSGNGYGCFQVHRIFNEGEHWNSGEVLFAWNAWGIDKASSVDEIGIGSFVACESDLASTFSMDYTFTSKSGNGAKDTLTAEAYSVRRVEVWAASPGEPQHGKWIGVNEGSMSDPNSWDDCQVPVAGDTLDFSGVTSSITINCGDMGETKFGAVTNGTGVITFTGSFTATSFSDTSKVAVGANSTVTLDGDLVFGGTTQQYIIYTVAAGGRFVVTGHIEASSDMTSDGELFPYKEAGAGAIQAKGLVANEGTSDAWRFRLSSGSDGTANWIVGADGLSGSKYFFERDSLTRMAAIQPLDSDFIIATSIGVRAPLTLNTTGYDGNPHTITIGDGVGNGGIMRDRPVTIGGAGKVVANYDATALNTNHVNPFTVTNTATLALMPGSNLGTGLVTVTDGATLQVAQSAASAGAAAVTLGGNLTLKNGAVLGFNYTTRNEPKLDLTGKTVTFDEGATTNVVVKISASEGVFAQYNGGKNVLTSGGKFGDATVSLAEGAPDWVNGVSVVNGEIVLDVKPRGMTVIIR